MKRTMGEIFLPKENMRLRYRIFGDEKQGYGLEVTLTQNGKERCERCEHLTKSLAEIRRFGRAVVTGAVLPGFLKELVEEWDF